VLILDSFLPEHNHRLSTRAEEVKLDPHSGWSFTHSYLTGLIHEHARDEIHSSKTAIEEASGHSVISFAYPFGRYNRQIIHIVQDLFSCAFTDKLRL
jgi:hypothetical protein